MANDLLYKASLHLGASPQNKRSSLLYKIPTAGNRQHAAKWKFWSFAVASFSTRAEVPVLQALLLAVVRVVEAQMPIECDAGLRGPALGDGCGRHVMLMLLMLALWRRSLWARTSGSIFSAYIPRATFKDATFDSAGLANPGLGRCSLCEPNVHRRRFDLV
jgi:hypothetical protein